MHLKAQGAKRGTTLPVRRKSSPHSQNYVRFMQATAKEGVTVTAENKRQPDRQLDSTATENRNLVSISSPRNKKDGNTNTHEPRKMLI